MASPPDQLAAAGNGAAELSQLSAALGFHSVWDLANRQFGMTVTNARSSWVRRVEANSKSFYIKTYEYPTWRDRLRGTTRNTGPMCHSRAAREHAALQWLTQAGIPTPHSCGFIEARRFGWVTKCLIATEAFPGRDLASVLPNETPSTRLAIGRAVGAFVAKIHRLGFRDGNLDLRNLLLADDRSQLVIAKIDSPRHRIVQTGWPRDRLAHADWDRLLPQLREFDIAEAAIEAASQFTSGRGS